MSSKEKQQSKIYVNGNAYYIETKRKNERKDMSDENPLVLSAIQYSCFCLRLVLKVSAYNPTGYIFSDPSNVKYKVGSYASAYNTMITEYVPKWAQYCPKIGVNLMYSYENVYFHGELTTDTGAYATTHIENKDFKSITLYSRFTSLTNLEKYETIVHEFGHALGLNHTEPQNESISVMRAKDFNGKAYPLSDDIAGIDKYYK